MTACVSTVAKGLCKTVFPRLNAYPFKSKPLKKGSQLVANRQRFWRFWPERALWRVERAQGHVGTWDTVEVLNLAYFSTPWRPVAQTQTTPETPKRTVVWVIYVSHRTTDLCCPLPQMVRISIAQGAYPRLMHRECSDYVLCS